jgi:hypothetical protein
MHRRNFILTPIALASLWGSAQSTAQTTKKNVVPNSARIPIAFSKRAAGARPLWRDVDRLVAGEMSIQVDLWLRMDVTPPPPGGILIVPSIRIIEDSLSGRRPILNSDEIEGKSGPNSNEVHIVGTATGVSHSDVFRPLGLEFRIHRAVYFNPAEQSGATVSTVPGKDSFIIVTTS